MANNFRRGQQEYNQMVRNLREYERLVNHIQRIAKNLRAKRMNFHIFQGLHIVPHKREAHTRRVIALSQNINNTLNELNARRRNLDNLTRRLLAGKQGTHNTEAHRRNSVNFMIRKFKMFHGRRLARQITNAALNPRTQLGQRRLSREFSKMS